jgi:glycosyltransferase involved in cell wall biosynthesis
MNKSARVLVFGHRLEVGGTQVNTIELAENLRDCHDHNVTLFAAPGPMLDIVVRKNLDFVAAPDVRLHPSPVRIRALRAAVERFRPDIIHAWDWWQALEAYVGVHLPMGTPILVTDMMMELTKVLPKQLPTTFGIPALQRLAVSSGWRRADVLLPPVDTVSNMPGAADGRAFREQFDVGADEVAVVSVSRLAGEFKAGPLNDAMATVRRLGRQLPIKLLIVGDGMARALLQNAADSVNAELRRAAIVLVGPMIDPRPAYAAADVVVGMGGSALRALAFGKPLIVVGKEGFARLFSPGSANWFHDSGMYGSAKDSVDGEGLSESLARLASSESLRTTLGMFGRDFVVKNHSLENIGAHLSNLLTSAIEENSALPLDPIDTIRTGFVYLKERRFLCPSRDRIRIASIK